MKKKKVSRTLFNLTVRTPVMALFLFIMMILVVGTLAYNSKIDVYVNKTGEIQKNEADETPKIIVQLTRQELANIDVNHGIKWYFDRNERIYSASISDIQSVDESHAVVQIAIDDGHVGPNQDKKVHVELYSRKESVLHSLIRR